MRAAQLIPLLAIFGGFAGVSAFSNAHQAASPSPFFSVSPSPSASGAGAQETMIEAITVPSLESQPSVTAAEAAQLRKNYRKLLGERMKTLESTQKQVRKDSDAGRKKRFDEWTKQENQVRRKFFDENPKGADRRAYMKDLIARRKAMLDSISKEEKQEREDQKLSRKAMEELHALRLKEFDRYLKEMRRPPESLSQF